MGVQREALSEKLLYVADSQATLQDLAAGVDLTGPSFTQDYLVTDELEHLASRAFRYLDARLPVHFRGRAGSGKTALALYLAHELGRAVYFLNGDATRNTASLLGREMGIKTRDLWDRYIHSVQKRERETTIDWRADVLTQAALGGGTLVYDEFTRSPAEANNALLSVLEEGILVLPAAAGRGSFAPVHDDFRIIFTSNSMEYAGVQTPQDALIDRMITFDLDDLSADTETAIVAQRTSLEPETAGRIVTLVRAFRQSGSFIQVPTMRASLMIAQVARRYQISAKADDPQFFDLVSDVLLSKGRDTKDQASREELRELLFGLIETHCPVGPASLNDEAK
ncbi:MAG: gas vesicle protein GvpN, partial [Pseudomonadota bacterium]